MFADLALFRHQLTSFRSQLQQYVWGDTTAAAAAPPRPPQAQSAPKATAKAAAATPKATASEAPQAAPKAAAAPPDIETAVFDYLQSQEAGARLTEIESGLGINRFQAVDALRSLIQQDLIVQKDRTYSVQEEAPQ
jgi:uncharacterized membrane protein